MIKILCSMKENTFIITIDKKVIKYWDAFEGKIWGTFLQWLPPCQETINKIRMSRNKIPAYFIDFLFVPADELAEFNAAKDDKELLEIVKKDLARNFAKIEKIEGDE